MSHITKEALLDELIGHCTPYLGHIERYYEALQNLRAALAQPEPVKLTKRQIESIYCADTDAGDWHMPHDNYAAGLRMGLKLAAAKGGV